MVILLASCISIREDISLFNPSTSLLCSSLHVSNDATAAAFTSTLSCEVTRREVREEVIREEKSLEVVMREAGIREEVIREEVIREEVIREEFMREAVI